MISETDQPPFVSVALVPKVNIDTTGNQTQKLDIFDMNCNRNTILG